MAPWRQKIHQDPTRNRGGVPIGISMAGGLLAVDICRHNPMTYDFYTQCTCGQDGSNILDSVAELYKMQIDPMFLNILCSSFGEGCKNKAPTKKKIWSYLRVDKRGSHGDFCQMTGHDSWISEQSKHRNNRAAQAHQSRSNDCSVGIQRPCLRDGDRIWNDFVPLEWINYGLEGNMNQTYKMFAVRLEN